jgi:hypothetical protein
MVHALLEASRVLKPDGILIDLRPAPIHRRVRILFSGQYQHVGTMREKFDDDRAANRAVLHTLSEGLFKTRSYKRIDCNHVFDSLREFRVWLDEFFSLGELPPHNWLVQEVESARRKARPSRCRIVVSGPLQMRVLSKTT